MKKLVRLLLVTTVALVGVSASAIEASAGCVRINRIYYNSPGTDNRTNSSLNAEWIRIKNGCATRKTLTSWKIKDAAGHTYTFPTFRLGSGNRVKVHTGKGTNTSVDLYWGSGNYIWNNDRDTARLINSSGSIVDRCSYNNPNASYVNC